MDEQIGRYQILEEIASGGQGAVYRVFDPDTGQIVALKVLHASLSNDSTYVERFRREASLAASIDHPNVVKIFEVGQDVDQHFMALEFLPESLARVIEGGGQMRLDRVAEFGVQIADGLAEAHALGIVHRDIKPQNILLGPDGVAKVTDFGIARSEALTSMTATGAVMGTPHYMSPEQSRGEEADARSDVYSLGCLLYQMVSGELPFKGNTPLAVIRQQIEDEPTPIRELRADLTPGLEAVVERSMAKDPGQRYQSVAEMAEALRTAVPGLAGRARAATAPKEPTPPEPPRERETAATPRPSPVGPRGGTRKLSRPRSLVRIGAAVVLLLWGVFLFAPGAGQASKGELIVAILFAASGVSTVSAAFLMLRRTKFKIGNLGWGPQAALLAVMGFVLFTAANGAGPDAATIPEGGPEAVALVPAPSPTATPTMTPAPNATPGTVIAPAVPATSSPTRTPLPAQSPSPIASVVETPVPVVVAPATATATPTPTPTSTATPVPPTATPTATNIPTPAPPTATPSPTPTPVPPTAIPSPTPPPTTTPIPPTPTHTPSPTELAEQLVETAKELLDDFWGEDEAISVLDQALQLYPQSDEAYYLRGKARRSAFEIKLDTTERESGLVAAIEDLTQAISLNPMIADYWYERGRAQFDRRAYRRALEDFSEAILLNPNVDVYYYHRGQSYEHLRDRGMGEAKGDYERVVEDYSNAIRLNPLSVQYFTERAGAYRYLDQGWKAIDDYSQAIRLDPENHRIYMERGRTYRSMSNEIYEQRYPSLPSIDKSKWERAVEDYDTAIKFAPDIANYYFRRGMVYRDMARDVDLFVATPLLRKAIENYTQALTFGLSPYEETTLYKNRAWVYTGVRDYEQAIRDFTSAIDLGDTGAYGDRGFVYAIMGLDQQAASDFSEASKTDKNFFWLRNFAFNLSHHDSEDCFGVSNRFWPILCPDS